MRQSPHSVRVPPDKAERGRARGAGPIRQKGAGQEEAGPVRRKEAGQEETGPAREEMIRIDDERETMGAFVVNSFLLI